MTPGQSLRVIAAGLLLFSQRLQAAESAESLMKQGDALDETYHAEEALKYYLPAEKIEPNNADLLVHIARQYRHMVSDASSTSEKLRLGHLAIDYANRAAATAPNDWEAQLAVAISYGKLLQYEGSRDQIEGSRKVKEFVDKALKLNPKSDLAWHVLGKYYMVLANINSVKRALAQIAFGKVPEGTNEDAVRCFQKAIELNPTRPMHYIELGRTYAQMGRDTDAKREIERGLAMRNTEKDDPETKQKGREALQKLHATS